MDKKLDYRKGSLPEEYPLATSLTPWQRSVEPIFENSDALSRGTLFPGLDLPFMNVVNPDLPACPTTELMAIDFVCDELGLYLDTHADDKEAFALYQTFLAMAREGRERYVKLCGPVMKCDQLGDRSFSWTEGPWPWEYTAMKEG
ncbi:MAG: spore coat protein CotJB [Oscillospiraceae bacterium]|nr:spore coat protein CotJB [Oscillospiraceae bacterium]